MKELFELKYIEYSEALTFKMPDYQRKVNAGHRNRISRDIIKNNTYVSEPILVSSDLFVLDGQHRLTAYLQQKKATCRIPVIFRNENADKEMFLQANNQKSVNASHKAFISDIGLKLRENININIVPTCSGVRKYDTISAIEMMKGIFHIKTMNSHVAGFEKLYENISELSSVELLSYAEEFISIYKTYVINSDSDKFMITIPYTFAMMHKKGNSKEKDIIRVSKNIKKKLERPAIHNIAFTLYFMDAFNKGIRKGKLTSL